MSNKKEHVESDLDCYTLTANKNQFEVISLALNIFSRLQNGQLDWCFSMIPWKKAENLKEINPQLAEIKKLLIGMENGYLGIGNVSEEARIAHDIHKVIFYILHAQYCGEKRQTIFDKPIQHSNEPLALLESENNKEQKVYLIQEGKSVDSDNHIVACTLSKEQAEKIVKDLQEKSKFSGKHKKNDNVFEGHYWIECHDLMKAEKRGLNNEF